MQVAVENVSFAYTDLCWVLRDVSVSALSGQAIGLVGPNGSGKSTLLRAISGSLKAYTGSIRLGGREVSSLKTGEIARSLAMVEQKRTIGFDFTVRETVAMGRIPHRGRWTREQSVDREAVEQAMRWADVENLASRSIRALSGGEEQRVFLAMALAQQPDILLLDEPTTFLDLRHQLLFLSIVKDRINEGLTAVLAIHDLTLAAQTSDRLVMLKDGSVACTGPPEDVLTKESLRRVFGVEAFVGRHPMAKMVYVLPAVESDR